MTKEEKLQVVKDAVEIMNNAIQPIALSESGIIGLQKTLKKFNYDLKLFKEAIDIGTSAYIKQIDGLIDRNSAEVLLKKYGGIMFNVNSERQDPEMHDLVKYLNSKMSFAKPWVKSKAINEMKAMKKAGVTMQTLYQVALKHKTWVSLVDGLADVVVEVEVLSENK